MPLLAVQEEHPAVNKGGLGFVFCFCFFLQANWFTKSVGGKFFRSRGDGYGLKRWYLTGVLTLANNKIKFS